MDHRRSKKQRAVLVCSLASLPLSLGLVFSACGDDSDTGSTATTTTSSSTTASTSSGVDFCDEGDFTCSEDGKSQIPCLGGGEFGEPEACAADEICTSIAGCVQCDPSTMTGSCANGVVTYCGPGNVFVTDVCDGPGMECTESGCQGPCSPSELGKSSNVGCDFFPTVTLNAVDDVFAFAVAVAAESGDTKVTLTRGGQPVTPLNGGGSEIDVPAGQVKIIELPWVAELKGPEVDQCLRAQDPGATRLVTGGAYRLQTDRPVTVYQFSPLAFRLNPIPEGCNVPEDSHEECCGENPYCLDYCGSFSNDASLLLPRTSLAEDYMALSWPSTLFRSATVTITAVEDATTVQVQGRGVFAPGGGIDANGNGTVTLNQGDVLELVSANNDGGNPGQAVYADPTGTLVRADKRVQVISGHSCANIPEYQIDGANQIFPTGYCDHLEDSAFPLKALGTDYLVTVPGKPTQEGNDVPPTHVVRIAAAQAATITIDPPLDGQSSVTLDEANPFVEFRGVTEDVHVSSDVPFIVAQYMQGSTSLVSDPNTMAGPGDPSIAYSIPSAQFRDGYSFVASTTYFSNYVNIIAPAGTTVTLDGETIDDSEFEPVADTTFAVARHRIVSGGDVHTISASADFGIMVYGYGQDTSYMYPGGLDLEAISQPPPK